MQNIIIQGETLNYIAEAGDYPAGDGWSLQLLLNPRSGGTAQSINSTASGDDHLVQVSAAATTTWATGAYGFHLWAVKGGERYTVESGQVEVRPGLVGASGGVDTRSQAQKALDDANAALAAWVPTQKRYKIAGREMEFNSPADIIAVISHWTAAVKREQAAAAMAAGRPNPRKLLVRMGRA
jgi:hypothetical protein